MSAGASPSRSPDRSRARWSRARWSLLLAAALLTACGPSEDEVVLQEAERSQQPERVERVAFESGIELEVRGAAGLVAAAEAFVAIDDDLGLHAELGAELEGEVADDGSAVVIAGNGHDADLLVVYRNSPFCGLLPTVEVLDADDGVLRILVGNRIWDIADEGDTSEPDAAADGATADGSDGGDPDAAPCEDVTFTEAVALRFDDGDDLALLDIQVPGYDLVVP